MRSKVAAAPPSQDMDSCCVDVLADRLTCWGTVRTRRKEEKKKIETTIRDLNGFSIRPVETESQPFHGDQLRYIHSVQHHAALRSFPCV